MRGRRRWRAATNAAVKALATQLDFVAASSDKEAVTANKMGALATAHDEFERGKERRREKTVAVLTQHIQNKKGGGGGSKPWTSVKGDEVMDVDV